MGKLVGSLKPVADDTHRGVINPAFRIFQQVRFILRLGILKGCQLRRQSNCIRPDGRFCF